MKRKFARIAGSVAVIVASLIAGGVAVAITSNTFTYSRAQTGYLMLTPSALTPDTNYSADGYEIDFTDTELSRSAAGTACLSTGINLPQGAELTQLIVWYKSDNRSNLAVWLIKSYPNSGRIKAPVQWSVENDENARRSITFNLSGYPDRVVNNANSGWAFGLCLNPGTSFYAARLAYSYTSAGD